MHGGTTWQQWQVKILSSKFLPTFCSSSSLGASGAGSAGASAILTPERVEIYQRAPPQTTQNSESNPGLGTNLNGGLWLNLVGKGLRRAWTLASFCWRSHHSAQASEPRLSLRQVISWAQSSLPMIKFRENNTEILQSSCSGPHSLMVSVLLRRDEQIIWSVKFKIFSHKLLSRQVTKNFEYMWSLKKVSTEKGLWNHDQFLFSRKQCVVLVCEYIVAVR